MCVSEQIFNTSYRLVTTIAKFGTSLSSLINPYVYDQTAVLGYSLLSGSIISILASVFSLIIYKVDLRNHELELYKRLDE